LAIAGLGWIFSIEKQRAPRRPKRPRSSGRVAVAWYLLAAPVPTVVTEVATLEREELTDADRVWLDEHFRGQIFPVLPPLALDPVEMLADELAHTPRRRARRHHDLDPAVAENTHAQPPRAAV